MKRVKKTILGTRSSLCKGPEGKGQGKNHGLKKRRSVWPRGDRVGGMPRIRAEERNRGYWVQGLRGPLQRHLTLRALGSPGRLLVRCAVTMRSLNPETFS